MVAFVVEELVLEHRREVHLLVRLEADAPDRRELATWQGSSRRLVLLGGDLEALVLPALLGLVLKRSQRPARSRSTCDVGAT
jgi:hypothetical protein